MTLTTQYSDRMRTQFEDCSPITDGTEQAPSIAIGRGLPQDFFQGWANS